LKYIKQKKEIIHATAAYVLKILIIANDDNSNKIFGEMLMIK
jgi:hypothetical protein